MWLNFKFKLNIFSLLSFVGFWMLSKGGSCSFSRCGWTSANKDESPSLRHQHHERLRFLKAPLMRLRRANMEGYYYYYYYYWTIIIVMTWMPAPHSFIYLHGRKQVVCSDLFGLFVSKCECSVLNVVFQWGAASACSAGIFMMNQLHKDFLQKARDAITD